MRSAPRDAGSVTVEFALVAPLVLLVTAAAVALIGAAATAIGLADGAGALARAEGRDDAATAAAVRARLPSGTRVEVDGDDPVCVRLSTAAAVPLVADGLRLDEVACAPGGGG